MVISKLICWNLILKYQTCLDQSTTLSRNKKKTHLSPPSIRSYDKERQGFVPISSPPLSPRSISTHSPPPKTEVDINPSLLPCPYPPWRPTSMTYAINPLQGGKDPCHDATMFSIPKIGFSPPERNNSPNSKTRYSDDQFPPLQSSLHMQQNLMNRSHEISDCATHPETGKGITTTSIQSSKSLIRQLAG